MIGVLGELGEVAEGGAVGELTCPSGRCYGSGPWSVELSRREAERVNEAATSWLKARVEDPVDVGAHPSRHGFPEISPGGAAGARSLTAGDAHTAAHAVEALIDGLEAQGLSEDLAEDGAFALLTAVRNAGYTGDSAPSPSHPGVNAFRPASKPLLQWVNQRYGVTPEGADTGGRVSQDELSLMQHYMYGRVVGVPRDLAHHYYDNATSKDRDSSDAAIDLQWQSYLRGRLHRADPDAALAVDGPFGDGEGTDSFDPVWKREFPEHRP